MPATDVNTQTLGGWGNFPVKKCPVARPSSVEALRAAVTSPQYSSCISRGLGRSYGDSAIPGDGPAILHERLNRFLSFDPNTGILECEAGVSLAEIIEVFLPRGWFLPTTPGTKHVTLGGAIAADVHGKNHHHDGSFGNHVLDLRLLTASGEIVTCGPRDQDQGPNHDHDPNQGQDNNNNLFWATVGGMGLTGAILSARLQLCRVETAYCQVQYKRTADLDQTLGLFETTDRDYRYSVAWIDCLASGKSLGRSVVMLGNDASVDALPTRLRDRPLAMPKRRNKTVPFFFPRWVLNPLTVKAFNGLFYARHGDRERVIDYNSYFYPLDAVSHWNRIYGKRGFIQYQALFPPETSRRGLVELLQTIARTRRASFLAVLKRSGPGNRGLLSFLREGHTLALDLPNTGNLRGLVRELDAILMKHAGRLYLAKDALMTPDVFRTMYDRLDAFRAVKRAVDPHNRFVSLQARRLEIVGYE